MWKIVLSPWQGSYSSYADRGYINQWRFGRKKLWRHRDLNPRSSDSKPDNVYRLKKYRKFSADFFRFRKSRIRRKKVLSCIKWNLWQTFFCFSPKKNFGRHRIPEISVRRSFSGAFEFREDPVFFKTSARPVASIQSGDITLAAIATISVTNYQTLHP